MPVALPMAWLAVDGHDLAVAVPLGIGLIRSDKKNSRQAGT